LDDVGTLIYFGIIAVQPDGAVKAGEEGRREIDKNTFHRKRGHDKQPMLLLLLLRESEWQQNAS
jgi:hypothetical protein